MPQIGQVLCANVGWTLGLSGRLDTVFLWKNAMQTLRSKYRVGAAVCGSGHRVRRGVCPRGCRRPTNVPLPRCRAGSLFMAGSGIARPQMVERRVVTAMISKMAWNRRRDSGTAAVAHFGADLWVRFALGCAGISAAAFPSSRSARLSLSTAAESPRRSWPHS